VNIGGSWIVMICCSPAPFFVLSVVPKAPAAKATLTVPAWNRPSELVGSAWVRT
jgi:hypothetical protein